MKQNKKPWMNKAQFWKSKAYSHKEKTNFTFQLVGPNKVLLTGTYALFTDQVKKVLHAEGAEYSNENHGWFMNKPAYRKLYPFLQGNVDKKVIVHNIPNFAEEIINFPFPYNIICKKSKVLIEYKPAEESKISIDQLPVSVSSIYKFQKDGVLFGLKNHGRALIADEMGVGKTLQSLCIAYLYKNDWPLLIICPATLKFNWKDEVLKWFGEQITEDSIQIIDTGKKKIVKNNKEVVICSYDMAGKIASDFQKKFQFIIADEAHYLKNHTAKRTKALMPLLSHSKRVLLLTGTPAFARPKEIYNLCSILRPDIFDDFSIFAARYCDPKPSKWSAGIDYDGSANTQELFYLLSGSFMIRRLKKDVLQELPDKTRQKVTIECNPKYVAEIEQMLSKITQDNEQGDVLNLLGGPNNKTDDQQIDKRFEIKLIITKCYSLTGLAKVEAACKFLTDLLENDIKFIVFAHHLEVLNKAEETLNEKKVEHIRIDGSVIDVERNKRVKDFETNSNIKVALLSLTAASQGLTLTSASTVVFLEMHWTPAIMMQAEDRCHRITQKSNVTCYYLYGDKTLDVKLYNKIKQKFATVSGFLNGEKQNLQIEEIGSLAVSKKKGEKNLLKQNSKTKNSLHNYMDKISNSTSFGQLESNHTVEKNEYKSNHNNVSRNSFNEKSHNFDFDDILECQYEDNITMSKKIRNENVDINAEFVDLEKSTNIDKNSQNCFKNNVEEIDFKNSNMEEIGSRESNAKKISVRKINVRKSNEEESNAGKVDFRKSNAGEIDFRKINAGVIDFDNSNVGVIDFDNSNVGKIGSRESNAKKISVEKINVRKPNEEKSNIGTANEEKSNARKINDEASNAKKNNVGEKSHVRKINKEESNVIDINLHQHINNKNYAEIECEKEIKPIAKNKKQNKPPKKNSANIKKSNENSKPSSKEKSEGDLKFFGHINFESYEYHPKEKLNKSSGSLNTSIIQSSLTKKQTLVQDTKNEILSPQKVIPNIDTEDHDSQNGSLRSSQYEALDELLKKINQESSTCEINPNLKNSPTLINIQLENKPNLKRKSPNSPTEFLFTNSDDDNNSDFEAREECKSLLPQSFKVKKNYN